MAPEVFRDPSMVDQKCDVYSFGVILWELLARKVPWAVRLFGLLRFMQNVIQGLGMLEF
jgi:serine/threonine protein kinase